MPQRSGSINPLGFQGEIFDLYSIPAYDTGTPEVLPGSEIGSTKQIVQEGDILLSKIVPHIRRCWVVGPSNGRRQIASGEWIVFRSDSVDTTYLRHALLSDAFHEKFMQTVSGIGGSLLRARPSEVAKIEVLLPALHEQRRIAAMLDTADSIQKKRSESINLADIYLDSVFAELCRHKEGTLPLGNIAEVITGFAFQSERYTTGQGDIRLVRGTNVGTGTFDWSDTAFYPSALTSNLERFVIRTGDVLLAMDRPWISSGLKCCIANNDIEGSLLVQRVARIRPHRGIDSEFIFRCLNSRHFIGHCRVTETTIPHISPRDLSSFPVPLIHSSHKDRFGDLAQKVQELSGKMSTHLAEASQAFKALSHRAFGSQNLGI